MRVYRPVGLTKAQMLACASYRILNKEVPAGVDCGGIGGAESGPGEGGGGSIGCVGGSSTGGEGLTATAACNVILTQNFTLCYECVILHANVR